MMEETSMKTLIKLFAIVMFTIITSCDPITGCSTVVGGDSYSEVYYLMVDFGDEVRRVDVGLKTFDSYDIGDGICFE